MVGFFFVGLMVPLVLIVYYGYQQFIYESYFQYRWKASNALVQINKEITRRITAEQERPAKAYGFYQFTESPVDNSLIKEFSPLAENKHPVELGIIGYFQINHDGLLETPLLPFQERSQIAAANLQMDWDEIELRFAIKNQIKDILLANGFKLNQPLVSKPTVIKDNAESYPFRYQFTDNHQIIFYRSALSERVLTQGFIVDADRYLLALIADYVDMGRFENTVQASLLSHLGETQHNRHFLYQINEAGTSKVTINSEPQTDYQQTRIFFGNLISPFQDFELRFSTDQLPMGPGSQFVLLFLCILLLVIIGGCVGFYWLGSKQLALAEQRLNFVSSVSHELKTPLTSILMYSEMLKANMVKKQPDQMVYYEFIYSESERLSRLINNMLKLSNISQQQEVVKPEYVGIDTVKDIIQSKVSSLVEKNSFTLKLTTGSNVRPDLLINLDLDAFSQIVINLVDNALKFYKAAKINDPKRQELHFDFTHPKANENTINITLRDFGPGISQSQQDKIFDLFYRGGSELTRTTPGTGIGLALVNELMLGQHGRVAVKRQQPGLLVKLVFECKYP